MSDFKRIFYKHYLLDAFVDQISISQVSAHFECYFKVKYEYVVFLYLCVTFKNV